MQTVGHNMPMGIYQKKTPHLKHLMTTRNAVLTDHLEKVVNDLVVSGRYQNASEVLREGLRLLEQKEAEETAKLESLRTATSLGMMSLEQGHFTEVRGEDLGQFLADLGEQAALSTNEKH